MTPQDLIDRYVHAVAERLPQRQRADVSAELRALLREELEAQPRADLEAAKALLLRFGAPDEAAARYAPPALVVEARDTRLYWRINGVIALIVGVLAFVGALTAPGTGADEAARTLYTTLLERLLTAVGSVTLVFWMIGWLRRRNPEAHGWKPAHLPPVRDPDQVHRVGWTFALLYFALGALVLAFPSTFLAFFWGGDMPEPARAALTYDPEFFAGRGRALFAFIIASLALLAWVIVVGRWTRHARIAQVVINVGFAGVMIWALRAGPIFVAEPADETMKAALAIFAIVCLIDAGLRARRVWGGGGAPLA